MYFNTEYLMLDSLTEYKTHLYYVILAVVVFFILLIWNVTVGFSESEKPPSLSIWGIAWIVLFGSISIYLGVNFFNQIKVMSTPYKTELAEQIKKDNKKVIANLKKIKGEDFINKKNLVSVISGDTLENSKLQYIVYSRDILTKLNESDGGLAKLVSKSEIYKVNKTELVKVDKLSVEVDFELKKFNKELFNANDSYHLNLEDSPNMLKKKTITVILLTCLNMVSIFVLIRQLLKNTKPIRRKNKKTINKI